MKLAFVLFLAGSSLVACGTEQSSHPKGITRSIDGNSDDALGRVPKAGDVSSRNFGNADLPAIPSTVPANWQVIATSADFSFRLPPELREVQVQPVDSYVALYQATNMAVMFDYGMYSAHADTTDEMIDGKRARILTASSESDLNGQHYAYYAEVRFDDIGRGIDNLSMHAYCKTPEDVENAKVVFRSIDFQ